uniref:zinc finger MYND domain-containing protein 15 isoform X2 n=1 Tax=Fragaria vesca subsp. vesca TaxID=101020 RepID=UPI0005C8A613|nr:PREDICTED: zinc finger MYND domain-containing protein 15 isoform X2 [Fragaria vesca subsp. vesca]
MECAGKRLGTRCTGPPTRRCARCEAVAYCSVSHQILHWRDHKEECERLEEQMEQIDILNEFPFTFSEEATVQETRCSFLTKRGVHQTGMWLYECCCGEPVMSFDCSRLDNTWDLGSTLCPCNEPAFTLSKHLISWKEYYDWRSIPLHSPVALLLHWPLTIYYATQLTQVADSGSLTSGINGKLHIHYLGPEKELLQLYVFSELHALFPHMDVHIDLIGPSIPQHRDGERIKLSNYAHCLGTDCVCKSSVESGVHTNDTSAVTLQLWRGLYHERYTDIVKDSYPHIVIAPNAGIAAYSSWLPTIELIKDMNIPAVFSDYCEEACHLGARCISSVTGFPPNIPIQLNPFRQPIVVENNALFIPCYSNCFLYGMSKWSA